MSTTPGDDGLLGRLRALGGVPTRGKHGVDTGAVADRLGISQRTVQRWANGTQKPSAGHESAIGRLIAQDQERLAELDAKLRVASTTAAPVANRKDLTEPDAIAERKALRGDKLRNTVAKIFTRSREDVDVTGTDDPEALPQKLRALAGEGRRTPHNIDTAEAAKRLGVTQRTVQRWLKGTHKPSPKHWGEIREQSRRTDAHKAPRAKTVESHRHAFSRGGWLTFKGEAGPLRLGKGPSYSRDRSVEVALSPEHADMLLDAYRDRGVDGAVDALYVIYEERHLVGWGFESIDELELRDWRQGSRHAEDNAAREAKRKARQANVDDDGDDQDTLDLILGD